jgi:hypothetical protein
LDADTAKRLPVRQILIAQEEKFVAEAVVMQLLAVPMRIAPHRANCRVRDTAGTDIANGKDVTIGCVIHCVKESHQDIRACRWFL